MRLLDAVFRQSPKPSSPTQTATSTVILVLSGTSVRCELKAILNYSLSIIINLTICGDWAGSTFNNDGCPGSCIDLANNNPSAFGEAYFDIASIDLYT